MKYYEASLRCENKTCSTCWVQLIRSKRNASWSLSGCICPICGGPARFQGSTQRLIPPGGSKAWKWLRIKRSKRIAEPQPSPAPEEAPLLIPARIELPDIPPPQLVLVCGELAALIHARAKARRCSSRTASYEIYQHLEKHMKPGR